MVRTNPKIVKPVTRSVELPKILRTASKSYEEDFRASLGLLGENEGRLRSSGDEFENSKDEIQTVNRASGKNLVRKIGVEDAVTGRPRLFACVDLENFSEASPEFWSFHMYQHCNQATLETWAVAFRKGNLESLCN
jgi:hypothetical protein